MTQKNSGRIDLRWKILPVNQFQVNAPAMNTMKPVIAGLAVVFIWSGWITLSRLGVHTQLQPSDITLLRYWTALLVVAPMVVRYPWRQFALVQYLVIGLGVGFPYTMLSFYGLKVIPAAHAGVLVNGMLPVLGAVAAWLLFRQRIAPHRYAAIGLIFFSNLIMSGDYSLSLDQLTGILLLLTAAVCYTFHMTGIRLWKMSWQDVIVIVPVVNVLIFTPLWFFFPSGLKMSTYHDMAVQAVYQGVIVNVIALMCVAYAIRHLGTITVALFMSFVPVTTAMLAWVVLGERLPPWEIAGIIGCSLGLLWYAREPKDKRLL
ncbi:MAG: DMT family transporter [Desulfobulbus sp.]